MNYKTWTRIIALALFAAPAIPVQLAAQNNQPSHHKYHHYQLIDLGTFGGPNSDVNFEPFQNVTNSNGTVVGGADTSKPTPEPNCYNPFVNPDCFISHAFTSTGGALKDLGTLPGGNFSFATTINQRGQVSGLSENDQVDPVTGNPEFHAVLWEDNHIMDLGTLGGVSSFASALNNHGQVTGVALNDVPDPYSLLGLGSLTTMTQTHGFLWQRGRMRDLGTLGGPNSPGFVFTNFVDGGGGSVVAQLAVQLKAGGSIPPNVLINGGSVGGGSFAVSPFPTPAAGNLTAVNAVGYDIP